MLGGRVSMTLPVPGGLIGHKCPEGSPLSNLHPTYYSISAQPTSFQRLSADSTLSVSKGHWNKNGLSRPYGTTFLRWGNWGKEGSGHLSSPFGIPQDEGEWQRNQEEGARRHPCSSLELRAPKERKMKLPTEIYIWDFQVFRGECRKDTFIERWQIPSLQIY